MAKELLIDRLYRSDFIGRISKNFIYSLRRELKNCSSVLDLGCGPESPVRYCNLGYSVGVDIYKPYIQESRRKNIHSEYIIGDVLKLEFKPKSFDAVIMIEVIEHLPENKGREILDKVEKWARKKVILSTPNGYLSQVERDGNLYQKHLSGWKVRELKSRGYKAYGIGGLKFLRKERPPVKARNEKAVFPAVRFQPKIFWDFILKLS